MPHECLTSTAHFLSPNPGSSLLQVGGLPSCISCLVNDTTGNAWNPESLPSPLHRAQAVRASEWLPPSLLLCLFRPALRLSQLTATFPTWSQSQSPRLFECSFTRELEWPSWLHLTSLCPHLSGRIRYTQASDHVTPSPNTCCCFRSKGSAESPQPSMI